jgi:protein TonB
MSEKYIEKNFLYLIILSVLLHTVLFVLLLNMPQEKAAPVTEPLMVDLDGIPTLPPPEMPAQPVERYAETKQRVEKEIAPKGEDFREKSASPPGAERRPLPPAAAPEGAATSLPLPASDAVGRERTPRDELFRKKAPEKVPEPENLYPSAARLSKLEESYRKKYGPEVADGETRFLNADDIQFGSFLRRFENSVYGVWRYPPEAAMLGIEGITPVKITFNRQGKIVGRELLQSSGSSILDAEVLRTLDKVGPIGGFPKGYDKETFNLIAFFHYGITQGARRSLR